MIALLASMFVTIAVADPPFVPEPDPRKPQTVRLDFRDKPAIEIVRTLGLRTGQMIRPMRDNDEGLSGRKLSLEAPEPVPYWEALDRLCVAGGLARQLVDSGTRHPAYTILSGAMIDYGPARYSGPFRIGALKLHQKFDQFYVEPPELAVESADVGLFYAEFELSPEPRVIALRTAPLLDLVAVDETGKSLLDPNIKDPALLAPMPLAYEIGENHVVRVRLFRPEGVGKKLAKLSGRLPVQVGVVPSEPSLVVPLEGSSKKTFTLGEMTLKIDLFESKPNGSMLRASASDGPASNGSDPSAKRRAAARNGLLQRQFEVVDAMGRPVPMSGSSSSIGDENRFEYHFVTNAARPQVPTHLRYYRANWADWDAPFDYRDLTLP